MSIHRRSHRRRRSKHPDRILLLRHVALFARVLGLRHRMCAPGAESADHKPTSPLIKMLENIRGKCMHT